MPPDLNTRAGKNSRFRHTLRFFREVAENTLDNPRVKCYIKQALIHKDHARVVELADSLDSGSSVHSGRAGSSPASRTKTPGSFGFRGFLLSPRFGKRRKSTVRAHGALIFVFLFLVAYAVIAFFKISYVRAVNPVRCAIRECIAGAFPSVNILSLVDTPATWMIYTNHFLSSSATLSDSAFAS